MEIGISMILMLLAAAILAFILDLFFFKRKGFRHKGEENQTQPPGPPAKESPTERQDPTDPVK